MSKKGNHNGLPSSLSELFGGGHSHDPTTTTPEEADGMADQATATALAINQMRKQLAAAQSQARMGGTTSLGGGLMGGGGGHSRDSHHTRTLYGLSFTQNLGAAAGADANVDDSPPSGGTQVVLPSLPIQDYQAQQKNGEALLLRQHLNVAAAAAPPIHVHVAPNPEATAGASTMVLPSGASASPSSTKNHQTAKASPSRKSKKQNSAVKAEGRSVTTEDANNEPSTAVFPCRARGVPEEWNHGFKTANFTVTKDTKHGDPLMCSHEKCRMEGVKFCFCAYCHIPVAKRNFRMRHNHCDFAPPAPPATTKVTDTVDRITTTATNDEGSFSGELALGSAASASTILSSSHNNTHSMNHHQQQEQPSTTENSMLSYHHHQQLANYLLLQQQQHQDAANQQVRALLQAAVARNHSAAATIPNDSSTRLLQELSMKRNAIQCYPTTIPSHPEPQESADAAFSKLFDTIRLPCRARGMDQGHTFETAHFDISPSSIQHGQDLICSYPACRESGVKFSFCAHCLIPCAKRNFRMRHTHSDTSGNSEKKQKQKRTNTSGTTFIVGSGPSQAFGQQQQTKDLLLTNNNRKNKRHKYKEDATSNDGSISSHNNGAKTLSARLLQGRNDAFTTMSTRGTQHEDGGDDTANDGKHGEEEDAASKDPTEEAHSSSIMESWQSLLRTRPRRDQNNPEASSAELSNWLLSVLQISNLAANNRPSSSSSSSPPSSQSSASSEEEEESKKECTESSQVVTA